MKTRILIGSLALAVGPLLHAAQLTQSTFTEVIRDVNVVVQADKATAPAKTNELFKYPDLVRTGSDSRAELTAADETITRVGANTVFSFKAAGRDITLEQGSVLFHSPSGKGGGTIKSGGASAAVLGTTIIVATTPVTTPNVLNGFKVIVLEGRGRVTLANGQSRTLTAGQMVFVLPGQAGFGPVLDINLAKLVAGSNLVIGFSHELPSMVLIQKAIKKQEDFLARGRAEDTGISANAFAGQRSTTGQRNIPGIGYNGIDGNTLRLATRFQAYQNSPFAGPAKAGAPPPPL